MKVFITGASGFVGSKIVSLNPNYLYNFYRRGEKIKIKEDFVFHFAGLAHNSHDENLKTKYFEANTKLTIDVYNSFINSNSKIFIFLSTIKVLGNTSDVIFENTKSKAPNIYGNSKKMAEDYILKNLPKFETGKKVYILRSPLIIGEKLKGNLGLINKVVNLGIPWIFASFKTKISILNILNLNFILRKICSDDSMIPSGIYNVADSDLLEVNELVKIISRKNGKRVKLFRLNKKFIKFLFNLGSMLKLPLINQITLKKITSNVIVDTKKISYYTGKLPFTILDVFKKS